MPAGSHRPLSILSVVTLVSPSGEYGGPVRVAVNQARALRELGHRVTVAGAWRGFDDGPPATLEGVPVQLFRARSVIPRTGFAGLTSPGLVRWLRRHLDDFDAVHVHLARDLVVLPAAELARRRGRPYVVQPHGMVDPSDHPLAGPLDRALTRRVLRDARQVLHLTDVERAGLLEVGGDDLALTHLPNGVPLGEQAVGAGGGRRTVLFLARLAPRKRPLAFVESARRLAPRFPDVDFVVVGPDEGEGPAVRRAVAAAAADGVSVRWDGPVSPEQTQAVLRAADVYVLPSVDEPFPMAVLEAMAAGLPVVVTDTCGLAPTVREAGAGHVVDAAQASLDEAVLGLLSDAGAAADAGHRGREHVRERMSMDAVARRLVALYDV